MAQLNAKPAHPSFEVAAAWSPTNPDGLLATRGLPSLLESCPQLVLTDMAKYGLRASHICRMCRLNESTFSNFRNRNHSSRGPGWEFYYRVIRIPERMNIHWDQDTLAELKTLFFHNVLLQRIR